MNRTSLAALSAFALGIFNLGMISTPANASSNNTVFIDCSASQNGTGTDTSPLNSIDAIKTENIAEGSVIAFRAGTRCVGSLTISSSGSVRNPIRITSWGQGAKPVIDGGGKHDSAAPIVLSNASHIQIDNLELTGGYWQNLLATASGSSRVQGLTFTNLLVHDNAWQPPHGGWIVGTGGIVVQPCSEQAKISQVMIESVETRNHNEAGIQVGYTDLNQYDPRNEVGAHNAPTCFMSDQTGKKPVRDGVSDVVIRSVNAHHNAASGVQVFSATNVVIENSDLHHNGGGAGMNGEGAWWSNTNGVTAQYNSAYSNVRGRTGDDGSGLDADYMTNDSVIQYNYLSNNEGYGVSLIAGDGPSNNSVIRYNVMANNGTANVGAPDIMVSRADNVGSINGVLMYNNTLMRNSAGQGIRVQVPLTGMRQNEACNNLIYREGSSEFISTTVAGIDFCHNLYFTPRGSATYRYQNKTYRNLDSLRQWTRQEQGTAFANPFIYDWNYAAPQRPRVPSFTLKPNSPALGTGKNMPLPDAGDFYGAPLSSEYSDIGAIWGRR